MPGQELIQEIINIPAAKAQKDTLKEMLMEVDALIDSINQKASSYGKMTSSSQFRQQTEDLVTQNKQLLKVQEQLRQEVEKRATAESDLGRQLAEQKALTRERTTAVQQEAKASSELISPYQKLAAQYAVAARNAKDLAAAQGENSKAAKAAAEAANQLGEQLKSIDRSVGDNRRNVGNYVGAISILEKSLAEVKQRMDQFVQAGKQDSAQAQQLSREMELLEHLVSQQSKGFASFTMEIRANERALQTLRAAGMEGTAGFKELQKQVADARREFNEFNRGQKMLESEAPALTALTTAAKGLSGMYAVGAGASALFADGNEKVEKELNKLVAVMTILQGLEEADRFLKERNAITTALATVKEGALAAVLGVKNFILTGSVKATKAQTAAQEANIAVSEESIEVTEAQSVAEGELTEATEVTSVAMIGLRTALIATGIGAIVVLLVAAASAMHLFGDSTDDAAKEQEELNKALEKWVEDLQKAADASQAERDAGKEGLNQQKRNLELTQAAGADAYKLAAIKKQLAKEELYDLEAQFYTFAGNQEKQVEYAEKIKDKKAEIRSIELEDEKLSAQERAKFEAASTKVRAEAAIQANQAILASDKATEEQKIGAARASLVAQLAIIEAERKEKLSDRTLTGSGRALVNLDSNAQASKAAEASGQQVLKIREEYAKRAAAAEFEIRKAELTDESAALEAASQDQKKPLLDRLKAYADYYDKQRQLIAEDYNYQIQKAGLTNEELLNLQEQFHAKNDELERQATQKRMQIIQNALGEMQKKGELKIEVSGLMDQVQAYDALNKKLKEGKITLKEYEDQKKKLDDSTTSKGLQKEIDLLETIRTYYAAYGLDTMDIDKAIYENKKKLADTEAEETKQRLEKEKQGRQMVFEKTVELAHQATDLVFSLMDDQVERQKNAVQQQINATDQAYSREVDAIKNSTLTAQDKAAQIQMLDAETTAHKQQLALQEKKLDQQKAKFDKEKAIANIIENTAVAIMSVVSIPVYGEILAAIIAAMGAAELAKVIAQPIPQYATGTASAKGGWALTDEKGPELYIEPGGKTYMGNDKPTLRNLVPGTRIIPANEINQAMHRTMLENTAAMFIENRAVEKELNGMRADLNKQTEILASILGRQKAPRVNVNINTGFNGYINEQIRN